MGKIILYGIEGSPPVRACLLTLKALDLPYEFKVVDLLQKEHLSESFIKKNPQHTVPLLEDDGHYIADSHAIMAYLVRKYGKKDSLYPKGHLERAVVDQRLHYESGVAFPNLRNITYNAFFLNELEVPQEKVKAIEDVYELLDLFLKQEPYVAGDHLTIADFSLICTVSSYEAIVPLDAKKYPKVAAWMKKLEQLPYYQEATARGAKILYDMIKAKNLTLVS